jgi:pyruvate carboxylase subunit B
MSDYSVSIGDHQYQVKITNNRVLLDNCPAPDNLIPINGSGLHLLRQDSRMMEVHVKPQADDMYEVLVNGKRVLVRVESNFRGRELRRWNSPAEGKKPGVRGASWDGESSCTAAGDLVAPMPGLVVNVLVQPGDQVQKDQVLVVLESMKMQMQMCSAISGKVARLAVQAGAQVEKGALLVKIDPSKTE